MADELDIDPSEKWSERLFPDETTEEALARIVAQDPLKHGVTLEQRKARATALASRVGYVDQAELTAEDARIVEIGGDPNEMLPGNKPRYTVDEAGNVKDHETGEVHKAPVTSEVGDSNVSSSAETVSDILRPTPQGLGGDETGVEEIHAGQAVVEEGPGEAPEGLHTVGGEQDRALDAPTDSRESPVSEFDHDEAGDASTTPDQSARIIGAAGTDAVGGAIAVPVQPAGRSESQDRSDVEVLSADQANAGFKETNPKKRLEQEVARTIEELTACSFDLPIPQPSGPTTVLINPRPESKISEKIISEIRRFEDAYAPTASVTKEIIEENIRSICRHEWPDDPQPDTPCALCGLTFEKWANS